MSHWSLLCYSLSTFLFPVNQDYGEQTIFVCTLLALLLNILDKVTMPANNILHSSKLLSAHISSCSRKYTGCSRAAACNLLMENMFKVSHPSALFLSVTQDLQYLDGTEFNGLFSHFTNHMHSADCNCAKHPM